MYKSFNQHIFLKVILVSTLLFTLSGCGIWQRIKDGTVETTRNIFYTKLKQLKLDIISRHGLNQNEHGQPFSTVIRIYQLKNNKNFEALAYRDLLHQDKALLADDLLDSKQITLRPGEAVNINDKFQPETEYIGIVAFFNHINKDNPTWKLLISKKALSNKKAIAVELSDRTIQFLEPLKSKK